ncbi:MAG: sporulation integral membrane protein YtvI [Defluviitaleaceae bacterium]|nr:sporulation integral membrane protein YtvI [Defluviitaleaceae bacterium]
MREFYHENREKIDRFLFILIVAVVFYLFFTVFFRWLSPFFFGLIIALILGPLVRFLVNKLNFRRWIASLLCLLLFIALFSSLGAWLVNTLVRQISSFMESAPVHAEEISERLHDANVWIQRYTEFLPEGWYIPSIEEMAPALLGIFLSDGMRETGLRTLGSVPDFLINIVLALVSAYFFMSDGKKIYEFCKSSTPKWILRQMRQTRKGLERAMSGYFKAQGILMVMNGVIGVVGLLFLGNQYALLLGLLFAILDFLPILGPAIVLIPWALISIAMGNMHQAIGLLVIYAIMTIARQVLQPKILGDQMGAHPLASLMSIFIGFRIFGILGFIIGPALLMIFIAIRETNSEPQVMEE